MEKKYLCSQDGQIRRAAIKRLVFDVLLSEPAKVDWQRFSDVKDNSEIFYALAEVAPVYLYQKEKELRVFKNFVKLLETRPECCDREAFIALLKFSRACFPSEAERLYALFKNFADDRQDVFLLEALAYIDIDVICRVMEEKIVSWSSKDGRRDEQFIAGLDTVSLDGQILNVVELYEPKLSLFGSAKLISCLINSYKNYNGRIEEMILRLMRHNAVSAKLFFTSVTIAVFNKNSFSESWKVKALSQLLASDLSIEEFDEICKRLPQLSDALNYWQADQETQKYRWTMLLRGIRQFAKKNPQHYHHVAEMVDRCAAFDLQHWKYGLWLTRSVYQTLSVSRHQCLNLQIELIEKELQHPEPQIDIEVYLLLMMIGECSSKRRKRCQTLLKKIKKTVIRRCQLSLMDLFDYLEKIYSSSLKENVEFVLQQVLAQNDDDIFEDDLAMDIVYQIWEFCLKNDLSVPELTPYEEVFQKTEAEARQRAEILDKLKLPDSVSE